MDKLPVTSVCLSPLDDRVVFVSVQTHIMVYDLRRPEIVLRAPLLSVECSSDEINQVSVVL
jgi:hypothetical protein